LISYKNEFIRLEISVENLSNLIDAIEAGEAKNFLKNIGDDFLDYFYSKRPDAQSLLKKDCLSSLNVWNAVFNPAERAKYESKEELKKLIKGLNTLNGKVTSQDWIFCFLDFLGSFNPKTYRKDVNIKKFNRKVLYEMLSRVMKQAGETMAEILELCQSKILLNIVSFKVEKVHKSKAVFSFKTNSSDNDKSIVQALVQSMSQQSSKKASNVCTHYGEEMILEDPIIPS